MKRIRIMGLCLVAAVALTALGASSASALPEVGRCVAQAGTGKYKDAACTLKAGKKVEEKAFEFKKGAKGEKEGVNFTSKGTIGILETEIGTKIECKTQTATGKWDQDSGAIKEVESVVAKFNTCTFPSLSVTCQTLEPKGAEGEIITQPLKGPLGYISGEKTTKPVVGQELTPEKAKGLFVKFECGKGLVNVEVGKNPAIEGGNDCIIAPVTPNDVMSKNAAQIYTASKGNQVPQKFQPSTAKKCNLESHIKEGTVQSPWEPSGQTLETTVEDTEEALEIKA